MRPGRFILMAVIAMSTLWACNPVTPDVPDDTPSAPESMSIDKDAFKVDSEGASLQFVVTSPLRPAVESDSGWVTVADGVFKDYKITYGLKVAANESESDRVATLTVTAGSFKKTLKVTQEGREETPDPDPDPGSEVNITKTLVTPGATAKAQALYDYLLQTYGSKVISGIMANVNWNHEEADKVHAATGKYPALNCYDFIHILYSGQNWIDYSKLTPVTEWADAGGIVALMWHFNVPKSKDAGLSDVTCTPSETTFRASNVFKDGSWESKWFYEQMDKVVEVILALQDKGIAAIWRPFHEAAGNATAINQANWTKAWFWWGYDGAEIQKKLWKTMFDYFYSKGIRNLIWVWTTQNYNGNASAYRQDKDWYPGDEYVDIVGRDLYGYNSAQNAQEFTEIQAAYPKKMVTLAECGRTQDAVFASIPEAWSKGAKWSWFMPWYGSSMPDTAWWKTALNSDKVLSRSDIKI